MSALSGLPLALILSWSGGLRVAVTAPRPPDLKGEGTLDREIVLKVLGAHQRELEACVFREAARTLDVDGRLVLSWRISLDGSVASARVVSTTIKNVGAVSCIVRQVARWRFPAPVGGQVEVQHTLIARMEDAPSQVGYSDPLPRAHSDREWPTAPSSLGPPSSSLPCRVSRGPLDPALLSAQVREHHDQLGGCIDRAAAELGSSSPDAGLIPTLNRMIGLPPSPWTLDVEWVVTAAGTARDVQVSRSNARSSKGERCVIGALASWKFPPGKGGESSVACQFLHR